MFNNDKPVDWLLENYIQTKVCRLDTKDCKKRKFSVWISHKPSLFQHIGIHSSLKGKVQKLRDKAFGKSKLFEPHLNPESEVYTTINHYKNYRLSSAYDGETFFWGITPVNNSFIGFKYNPPINLISCLIRTGNIEHPFDLIYNATFQIKSTNPQASINYNSTDDGFVDLCHFNPITGELSTKIPNDLNPVQELRIHIKQDSDNWIIISEVTKIFNI